MYFLMRTDNGFVSVATSTDNGKTFKSNQFAYYSQVSKKPNKREIKSDRRLVNSDSPLSPYFMGNGKYLLPFYNAPFAKPFMGRNPLWITAGVESDGTILWSQPELLLYSDYGVAFAYPDIFEYNGNYYITESNKSVARVHLISKTLINHLFDQKYTSVLLFILLFSCLFLVFSSFLLIFFIFFPFLFLLLFFLLFFFFLLFLFRIDNL